VLVSQFTATATAKPPLWQWQWQSAKRVAVCTSTRYMAQILDYDTGNELVTLLQDLGHTRTGT
jgi:hypothetical protein